MKISKVKRHYPNIKKNISSLDFENVEDFHAHKKFVGTEVFWQADLNSTGSDLGEKAAHDLLEGIQTSQIDFLIFSSLTLDYATPTTSSVLHKKLGLKHSCGTMDLPYGCAGFPMGLMVAQGIFQTTSAHYILLVFGEVPTRAVHPEDLGLKFLFGDAGVAVLLERSESKLSFVFGNDGEGFNYLNVPRGGARNPFDSDFLNANAPFPQLNQFGQIHMDGLGIMKMTLKHIPSAVNELLKNNNMSQDDIQFFIFHHASNVVIETLQRKLSIPSERMVNYMSEGGNTVSCTIPIAWLKATEEKRFSEGDNILVMGFGVGFSWCGTILKYSKA